MTFLIAGIWTDNASLEQIAVKAIGDLLSRRCTGVHVLNPTKGLWLWQDNRTDRPTLDKEPDDSHIFMLHGQLYKPHFCDQKNNTYLRTLVSQGDLNYLNEIDGSFVLVTYDKTKRKLTLIRDRLGTKPLYYLRKDNLLVFATSILPIITSGLSAKKPNLKAIDTFLSYGYFPAPETPFDGIRQIMPGSYLAVEKGVILENRYWKFAYPPIQARRSPDEDTIHDFALTFERAVRRRIEAHPNAGCFLSGGLDTSVVAAVMRKLKGEPFKVFSAGFEEKEYNEIEDARIVARHLGLDLHTVLICFDSHFPDLLEHIVSLYQTPFADTSAIPSYYVSKLARDYADTILSGDFPDQLIGGSGHQVVAMLKERTEPPWKRWLRSDHLRHFMEHAPFKTAGTGLGDRAKRFLYRETFPIEEQRILLNMPVPPLLKKVLYSSAFKKAIGSGDPLLIARSIYSEVSQESLLNKILYFDIHSYAPDDLMVKVDRMASAHKLNVISPFHDCEIVEFVAGLPEELKISWQGERKVIMRRAFKHLLPEHTFRKKKQGFAMPIGPWLKRHLANYIRDLLLDCRSLQRGYFDPTFLRNLVNNFLAGKTDYASGSETAIISLMTLEIWHRKFIDH